MHLQYNKISFLTFSRAGVFDQPKFKNSNSNNNISSEIGKVLCSCQKNNKRIDVIIRNYRKEEKLSMSLEFAHAGTCAVVHHQHCQMVDLLMQHCRKSMGGSNPHALPHAPPTQQGVEQSNTYNTRNKNNNAKLSVWNTCEKKKGRKCINNNKNQKKTNKTKIEEDEIMSNRFSQSQNMVGDMTEATELLHKVADNDNNKNEDKDDKTTNKDATSCDADEIDESILGEVIKSFVKNDRHGKEQVTCDETSNACSNDNEEKYEDNDNENDLLKKEESSCESDNDECDHDAYHCNSYSDDDCSKCPSDYNKWAK